MRRCAFSRAALVLTGLALMAGCTPMTPSMTPGPTATGAPSPSPTPSPVSTMDQSAETPAPPDPSPAPGVWREHGFVVVSDVVPLVLLEVRYYSSYNFVGERIDGYGAPLVLLTKEAAEALKKAAEALAGQGYILKIYDGYRPQRAVDHFIRWAGNLDDQRMKSIFYPGVNKEKVFDLGYLARRSGHSRGSTVDLTLVDMKTGRELDMGSPFDYFGEISHHGTPLITERQAANRNTLKSAMEAAGFKPYSREWWHYTLIGEPYPDTYFDFTIG